MTTKTLTYTGELIVLTCWCGMRHAVPLELRRQQEAQHRDGLEQISIYCPLGHSHILAGEGEAARLKRLAHDAETSRDWYRDQLTSSERSLAATRGVVTKLRKRVVAGVCPFGCHRHFVDLERHVASKHPGQPFEGESAP